MKIAAYDVREDEKIYFEEIIKQLDLEIVYIDEILSMDTIELAKNCDGVSILGHSQIDSTILNKLKDLNIKYISTRTVGYNHIDLEYANKIGIKVSNSNYPPSGVAEYTVMLMLMSSRNYKQAMFRGNVNDYSLAGLRGKEIKDLTVGVIGSGKIGCAVIDILQGFGCKIIVYDKFIKEEIKLKAEYVDLETLYKDSDVITLHTPLLKETYHMINKETINKMKDGVILINCARGELMDIEAVIEGIEEKKIGALGLDVIENEEGIYHKDRRTDILINRQMAYIRQFPNVTMTQHIAFYTDTAVKSMVTCSVKSLVDFINTGKSELQVTDN